jgi:hypothetical protein
VPFYRIKMSERDCWFISGELLYHAHDEYKKSLNTATCLCRLTVTRLVSHVEQGLLTLTAHLNFPRIFSGVRIARSLVFFVMFCRSSLALFLLLMYATDKILFNKMLISFEVFLKRWDVIVISLWGRLCLIKVNLYIHVIFLRLI